MIPGVKCKFGFGVQNKVCERLTEFCQENALVTANILFQQHKRRLHTGTSPDGKDWRQEEKGTTKDEMVGWHHRLDWHEFEQSPVHGCMHCGSQRVGHDWATELDWEISYKEGVEPKMDYKFSSKL